MQLGDLEIRVVSGGKLWIDGGAMFGVVPRVVWSRKCEPDTKNRILLDTNCLLIEVGDQKILVDSGYGSKPTDRDRENQGLETGHPLVRNLALLGVKPEDIDTVILTHLHFDHVGGCIHSDDGVLRPVFCNARHVVQRDEWEDAVARKPELVGAYFEQDILPLEKAGLVDFVEGDVHLLPQLHLFRRVGHTRGHQIVRLGSPEQSAVYTADLCPFAAHMRTIWSMAYDQFPLDQRRNKAQVLGQAADEGQLVLFGHDPIHKAAYIVRDPKQDFTVSKEIHL